MDIFPLICIDCRVTVGDGTERGEDRTGQDRVQETERGGRGEKEGRVKLGGKRDSGGAREVHLSYITGKLTICGLA